MDIFASILEGESFCIPPWKLQVEHAFWPHFREVQRVRMSSLTIISIWFKHNV
jgi:hypothetical protein